MEMRTASATHMRGVCSKERTECIAIGYYNYFASKMEIRLLHTEMPHVPCPNCKQSVFAVDAANLYSYFQAAPICCEKCNRPVDWWTLLLKHAELRIPFYLYGLVGAYTTLFVLRMKPNEITPLDLADIGVPADAHILNMNYTPNGPGLFPIEVHGNAPIRHFAPHKLQLFGLPFGEPATSTPVAISVSWVQTVHGEESWQNLVQALEAYSINKFDSAIVPANVAVESRLASLLQEYYSRFASQNRIEDFLTNRATYSYQLNVLLPVMTHYLNFPNLPNHIVAELNKLRNMRNNIAHKGKLAKRLDKSDCARLVCASIFGFGFVELLEKQLRENACALPRK